MGESSPATAPITAEQVVRALAGMRLDVPAEAPERLARYLVLLQRWNRVYNLTGIRESDELLRRHLIESLVLGPLLEGRTVADIGTGAGLPGLPLAICHADRRFTLIESRRKRVTFLRHVVAALGLDNVSVAHSRAEDLPITEPFATVLARAVAPPVRLISLARPLVAEDGVLLLLTSAERSPEIVRAAIDFSEWPVPEVFGTRLRSSVLRLKRERSTV